MRIDPLRVERAGPVDGLAERVGDAEVEVPAVDLQAEREPVVVALVEGVGVVDGPEAGQDAVQSPVEEVAVEPVDVPLDVHLVAARPDVVHLDDHVSADAALDAEEPVVEVHGRDVAVDDVDVAGSRQQAAVLVDARRQPRRIRIAVRQDRRRAEAEEGLDGLEDAHRRVRVAGQVGVLRVPDLVGHALVETPGPAPDGHAALVGRIPGEAEPRTERVLPAAEQAAVEVVLPLHHVGGREVVPQASRLLGELQVGHDVVGGVVDVQEALVAQAGAEGEVRLDLPLVLDERRQRLRPVEPLDRGGRPSGARVDRDLALRARPVRREVEDAVEVERRSRDRAGGVVVGVLARVAAAELHAVRPARPGHDVRPVEAVLHEDVRAPADLIALDAGHADPGDVAMMVLQHAVGPHPRELHLVHHVRRDHLGVVRVELHAAGRRRLGEAGVDLGRAEADLLRGRAIERRVETVLAVVEVVIETGRPLEPVPGRGLDPGPGADHGQVAGHGADGGVDRRRARAARAKDLSRGPEVAIGGEGGGEVLGDLRRDVVRSSLLHELDELRREDVHVGAHRDVRAQHVSRDEEEGLVLADGTAEAPGELLAPVAGVLEAGHQVLEIVLRLHGVVGVVPAEAPVEVVRAALGDDVHQHGAVPAVLRREVVHEHADFLDALGVGVDVGDAAALAGADRRRIHHEVVGLGAGPVGAHVDAVLVVVEVGVGLRIGLAAAGRPSHDTGREDDEIEEVASDEGQVLDLVLLDQAGDASLRGLDQRRLGGDRHLLGPRVPDLQHDVDGPRLGRLEPDVLPVPGLEALKRDLDGVDPSGQGREAVVTGGRRVPGLRDARGFVRDGDGRAGDDAAAGVRHRSFYRAGELRPGLAGGETRRDQQRQRQGKSPDVRHTFASC